MFPTKTRQFSSLGLMGEGEVLGSQLLCYHMRKRCWAQGVMNNRNATGRAREQGVGERMNTTTQVT